MILKKSLFSYGRGPLLKNGNHGKLEQELASWRWESFWRHSYRGLLERNTQLMQAHEQLMPWVVQLQILEKVLWRRVKFNVYLIFHCLVFLAAVLWSIFCRAGLPLCLKVIRLRHDSAILPARRVLHSLLAIVYIPYSCLSRVNAEIHFLLKKVMEPSHMQTLTLWSLGDLNSM